MGKTIVAAGLLRAVHPYEHSWLSVLSLFCLIDIATGGISGMAAYWGGPGYSYLGMALSSGLTPIGIVEWPYTEKPENT